jgi:hypothetical protein
LKSNTVQTQSQLKIHNILAVSSLLYGCQIRILKQRDVRRLKTAESEFMTRKVGYSLVDKRRNEDISEALKVDSVEKNLANRKQKWLTPVIRMETLTN